MATGNEFSRHNAGQILDYVSREGTDSAGRSCSTYDGHSAGVEGKFFTWTPTEAREVTGAKRMHS